jgi:CHRD domain
VANRRGFSSLTFLEFAMTTRHAFGRFGFAAVALPAVVALGMAGCGFLVPAASNMVAFTTQLRGANEVPPAASPGNGSVDAAFNKDTMQLRWKVTYAGMTGQATAGHFHGPAAVGANAGVALGWTNPITTGMQGSATLTSQQAADLIAGRWYANIHSAAFPGGELRGQMVVRN